MRCCTQSTWNTGGTQEMLALILYSFLQKGLTEAKTKHLKQFIFVNLGIKTSTIKGFVNIWFFHMKVHIKENSCDLESIINSTTPELNLNLNLQWTTITCSSAKHIRKTSKMAKDCLPHLPKKISSWVNKNYSKIISNL